MDIIFVSLRVDWLMSLLILYLMFKMWPKRHDGLKQQSYCYLLIYGLTLSVSNFMIQATEQGALAYDPRFFYFSFILYFLALSFTTYGWFTYSEYVMESNLLKTGRRRLLISLPLIIYFLLCVTSHRTHLLFYLDDEGHYCRGVMGGILQFLIPGFYLLVLLCRIIRKLIKDNRADSFMRGVIFYPTAHAVALLLQVYYGHDYIVIASVASLLVAYIELHSIEEFKMERANAETLALRRQYHIIDALSRDFEDVFLLNFNQGTSTTFKLHGRLVKQDRMRTYSYNEAFENYSKNYIVKEDRDKVASLFPIEIVLQKLEVSPTYSFSYRVNYQGEIHHYQVKYSKVENEDNAEESSMIIFGYQCIDEMVNMRRLSYTDNLTGLLNRHALEEKIHGFDLHGMNPKLVVLSADVNGLKQVNDTLGHSAGDELLIGAAQCLVQSFGPYGSVYRLGGDEFMAIIIANESNLRDSLQLFQARLNAWRGAMTDHLSVSIGHVSLQEYRGCTIHQLTELADQKMYQAKAAYYAEKEKYSEKD